MELERYIDSILPMVRRWKADPHLELEIQLGYFMGAFIPNVDHEFYQRVVSAVKTSKCMTIEEKRFVSADYKHPDQKASGSVRVRFFQKGAPHFCIVSPAEKIAIKANNRPYSLQTCLKREQPIEYDYHSNTADCIRLQTRMDAKYQGWTYSFTVVKRGKDNEEAIQNDPVYSIELEPDDSVRVYPEEEIARLIVERGKQLLGTHLNGEPNTIHFSY